MAPDFPKPTKRERGAYRASAVPVEPPSPKVVHRPEPPREGDLGAPNAQAKLTSEEIGALLKVHAAKAPTKWQSVGGRVKVLVIPTNVVSILLSFVIGTWGYVIPFVLALVIACAPLLRSKREGWS